MIKKYVYGEPFETEALTENIETAEGKPGYGEICAEDGFSFTYIMDEEDIVYGLGESNRGINKRGFIYTSNCTDDPEHTEDTHSLYGAHNLIIVSGKETFGMFFDYPAAITFDHGCRSTPQNTALSSATPKARRASPASITSRGITATSARSTRSA